jgi:integrase
MYNKSASRKAAKGSVQVKVSNERLQLVFRVGEKRYYLSTGLADTTINRKLAERKAALIEDDIFKERFDPTLEKYRPKSASPPGPSSVASTPVETPKTCLIALWEKYTEFKRSHLEETTIIRDYGKIEKRLKNLPQPFLEDAVGIQADLLKKYAAETAKRTLKGLSGCCDWAIRKRLITDNPFRELFQEIKSKKKSKVSRKPFSRECVAAIISAFENNTYASKYSSVPHSFYLPYVKFLLHTGCRPEEAVALKWKHVEPTRIYICEAMPSDVRIRKVTKTDKPRYFPINPELEKILDSVRPEDCHPDSLVFTAVRNRKEIDTHDFLNRTWKPIVEKLVAAGQVKEYLPQYNCRHTFITLCLEDGISSRKVAEWCGTSVAVIEQHYAGAIAQIQVPSFRLGTDVA